MTDLPPTAERLLGYAHPMDWLSEDGAETEFDRGYGRGRESVASVIRRDLPTIIAEARADLAARIVAAVGGLRVGPGKSPNIARLAHDEAIDAVLATIRAEADR